MSQLLILCSEHWRIPSDNGVNEYHNAWAIDQSAYLSDENRKGFVPIKYQVTPQVLQKLGDLKTPTKFDCTITQIPGKGGTTKPRILDVKPC